MTEKDKELVRRAEGVYLDYGAIWLMMKEAETDECKRLLNEEYERAFIYAERSYLDTI